MAKKKEQQAKITKLSPEQWEELRQFREEKRLEALITDSIDQEEARAAIRQLYTASGLPEPKQIIFCKSPMQCLITRAFLRYLGKVLAKPNLGTSIGIPTGLVEAVSKQLNLLDNTKLRETIYAVLNDVLKNQLFGSLNAHLIKFVNQKQTQKQIHTKTQHKILTDLSREVTDACIREIDTKLWHLFTDDVLKTQISRPLITQLREIATKTDLSQKEMPFKEFSSDIDYSVNMNEKTDPTLLEKVEDVSDENIYNQLHELWNHVFEQIMEKKDKFDDSESLEKQIIHEFKTFFVDDLLDGMAKYATQRFIHWLMYETTDRLRAQFVPMFWANEVTIEETPVGQTLVEQSPVDQSWPHIQSKLHEVLSDDIAPITTMDSRREIWDASREQLQNLFRNTILQSMKSVFREHLRNQKGAEIKHVLNRLLHENLWEGVDNALWNNLYDNVKDVLRIQILMNVVHHVKQQLYDQFWDNVKGSDIFQETWFIGSWDYFWLTFYVAGRKIGIKYSEEANRRLDAYIRYAETCGIAYLYPDIAFVSDRPNRYSFDAQRRLHAIDGPALSWRDGYAIYAWHGIRVPPEIIERRMERTPSEILKEQNAELRRVMMEIYAEVHGAERFITDLGAKLISEDMNHGHPRRLYQVGQERFLSVVNGSLEPDGSRRAFILGANPNSTDPHDAVATSYGRPPRKYREAVRS